MATTELASAVSRVLESRGVLADLRAQLRLTVFQAIDDEERGAGKPSLISQRPNPKRDALLSTGALASLICDTCTHLVADSEAARTPAAGYQGMGRSR